MADYPSSLPQMTGSVERNVDPIMVSRSRGGSAKGRFLQGSTKKEFAVVHQLLTSTQRDTLITFLYTTKRGVTFTFAWNWLPGTSYTVLLNAPNGLDWQAQGPYWNVTVPLAEA